MVGIVEKRVTYETTNRQYVVGVISDLHIGNKGSDHNLIRRQVAWLADYSDAVILGGDYCDHIDPKDRRFDWGTIDRNLATPDEQYEFATKLLYPLKGKVVMVLDGNHDLNNGTSRVERMAQDLGGKYVGYSGFLRLRFNRGQHRTKFDIYSHHGKTAARTRGGKVNKVMSMDRIFVADVYTMSHVHTVDGLKKTWLTVDDRLNIKEKETYYALTGGFLKGYEEGVSGYVEQGMYEPSSLGGIVLNLNCEKHLRSNVRIWDIPVEP